MCFVFDNSGMTSENIADMSYKIGSRYILELKMSKYIFKSFSAREWMGMENTSPVLIKYFARQSERTRRGGEGQDRDSQPQRGAHRHEGRIYCLINRVVN